MRNEPTGRANSLGIVLQGGGALGAYEWGVLQRLYAEDWFKPDVISGVSIGAITATTIAAPKCKDPVEALKTLWDALTISAPDTVPGYIQRNLAVPRSVRGPSSVCDHASSAMRRRWYNETRLA